MSKPHAYLQTINKQQQRFKKIEKELLEELLLQSTRRSTGGKGSGPTPEKSQK